MAANSFVVTPHAVLVDLWPSALAHGVADYTQMLRRPDEISHRALLLGMISYQPNDAKAHYYDEATAFDWAMIGDDAMAISKQMAADLGLRESGPA